MAVLNPIALLILYIALQAAPDSAVRITVHFSETQILTLQRSDSGDFYRTDDLGNKIFHRMDDTRLILTDNNREESIDLAKHFEITGAEDWSIEQEVRGKEGGEIVRSVPENDAIVITVNSERVKIQFSIGSP